MGSRCAGCGTLHVPPRAICPECRGTDMAWEQVKGTGTLTAFTCITMVTPALQAEGYGRDNPFCTGVVALDEGPRVVARIEVAAAVEAPEAAAEEEPPAEEEGEEAG